MKTEGLQLKRSASVFLVTYNISVLLLSHKQPHLKLNSFLFFLLISSTVQYSVLMLLFMTLLSHKDNICGYQQINDLLDV